MTCYDVTRLITIPIRTERIFRANDIVRYGETSSKRTHCIKDYTAEIWGVVDDHRGRQYHTYKRRIGTSVCDVWGVLNTKDSDAWGACICYAEVYHKYLLDDSFE